MPTKACARLFFLSPTRFAKRATRTEKESTRRRRELFCRSYKKSAVGCWSKPSEISPLRLLTAKVAKKLDAKKNQACLGCYCWLGGSEVGCCGIEVGPFMGDPNPGFWF